ncbi:acyl-CoA dehydrogenase family protein, partial [Streptomyces sp. NPDC002530]
MGIGITEEHRALAHSVRGWLTRAVPPAVIRELLDADAPPDPGARPAHWDALAGQGLLGIHLPEDAGGGGGDLLDLVVVLEEAGRAALPGPFLAHTLASAVLHACGAGEPVRALASGTRIGAVALGPGTLEAVEQPDGYRLDGTPPPVLSGTEAGLLVLPAATATGIRWFAVDADSPGLRVRPHRSADPTRPTAEIRADGVTVPAHRLLDADPELVRDLAAVLFAAEACGTAARCLDTATEHAKVREQFGRPIGRFQAVKHLCADMLVRLEQARALTWDAARAAVEDTVERQPPVGRDHGPRGLGAALAAATALDAAYGCAKDTIQILGGIGFTWEHDAHLYLRRALVARQLLGAGDAHRQRAVRLAADGARRELVL